MGEEKQRKEDGGEIQLYGKRKGREKSVARIKKNPDRKKKNQNQQI